MNHRSRHNADHTVFEASIQEGSYLASILESMPDIMFIKNLDGIYLHCNQPLAELLGKPIDQIIGGNDIDLFGRDRASIFRQEDLEVIRTGEQRKNIDWNLAGDNKNILLETLKAPYLDNEGKISGIIGISRDITERHNTQLIINEQDAEIENFFQILNDPLLITDPTGSIIKSNLAWERTFDSKIGDQFSSYIHPEERQIIIDQLAELTNERANVDFTCRMRSANGKWLTFEWRCHHFNQRLYLAARNITTKIRDEKIKTEQEQLLLFRQRFEDTLTSISTKLINMPVEKIDAAINDVLAQIGNLIDVDRSYVFIFDLSAETMTNTHEWTADGILPEKENLAGLPLSIFPWWIKNLSKLEVINVPIVSNLPDEASTEREILEMQNIQSVLVLPLISDNELIGFLGFDSVKEQRTWSNDSIILLRMVSDIISNAYMRFKYQHDLAQSERRKGALLTAVPDMILRIARDGTLLDIQYAADPAFNKEVDVINPVSLQNLVAENQQAEVLMGITVALESRTLQTVEFKFEVNNSSRVLEARFQASGTNEVTAIIRDVSERARLEMIKSDFINKATHELRTPLATMMLMSNLMDGSDSPEERSEYWEILKSELDREKTLVDDILTAGKLESPQTKLLLREFDLKEMFSNFFTKFQIVANEKGIDLQTKYYRDPSLPSDMFRSDENVLNQIFANLAGNAIKFTEPKGNILLALKLLPSEIEFTIEDNGIGIPAEDVPFLFSRFFRGANAINLEIQGTGIGLFIVRSLIEKLGGTIDIATKLGQGTKFIVKLPNAPLNP